jgi:hypothetical protein
LEIKALTAEAQRRNQKNRGALSGGNGNEEQMLSLHLASCFLFFPIDCNEAMG